jgi:hypothetical protein
MSYCNYINMKAAYILLKRGTYNSMVKLYIVNISVNISYAIELSNLNVIF